MAKFAFDFTLKQHTPIIHFQHDQVGATLRATEVKAKLDRYIWQKTWANKFENGKMFLVGYSPAKSKELEKRFESELFRALDYKIIFVAQDNKTTRIPDKMPLYFGNMSNEQEVKKEKHFAWAHAGVKGNIVSSDPDLIALLEQHLPGFFQTENFGTRQNKGFGSFSVGEINGSVPTLPKPSTYFFKINNTELKVLWEHIDLFYRTLRSGINLKGAGQSDKLYFKSLLFQYAKTREHQWDKRKIRLDLFKGHPKFREIEGQRTDPNGTVSYSKGTPMLYRDMLGLSSSQSWLSYRATVTKEAENGAIDRFKSPITFKPFQQTNGWIVYIIPHEIPREMKKTAFEVKSGGATTTLTTPEFDLKEYLKFAFGYFNDNRTIEDYLGSHEALREARIIENIYHQLSQLVAQ